jgi:hypothetical protein
MDCLLEHCTLVNIILVFVDASCALVKSSWICVNAMGAGLGIIDAEICVN